MTTEPWSMIKGALPLSHYISRFSSAPMKSNGNGRYRTTCPLHNGDNPTGFAIDDTTGFWKCFTGECGAGSIVDFWLMQNQTDDLGAALNGLAQELNITLPETERSNMSARAIIDNLDKLTFEMTEYLLGERSPELKVVRKYLKSRGISKRLVEDWQIGFIPSGPEAVQFIEQTGVKKSALLASGFINKNDDGRFWVPMNGRLIFPIFNKRGSTIGYGARAIEGVDHSLQGKYINSPESRVFNKSNVLYGQHLMDKGTEHAVIVEGYLDAIALNEEFDPTDDQVVALATCGTSLTSGHADMIRKIDRVSITVDGDVAGTKAISKNLWTINELEDRVDVIRLRNGEDPWDMYINDDDRLGEFENLGSPLLQEAVACQWEICEEREPELSDWVRSVIPNLRHTRYRDDLIREAARVVGQNVTMYRKSITYNIDINSRRAMSSTEFEQMTSPQAREVYSALLSLHPDDRDGILAAFKPWTSLTERAIQTWLPIQTDMDFRIIKRLVLGLDGPNDISVDRAIATIMASSSQPNVSVILKGMCKSMLGVISRTECKDDIYLTAQIKSLRKAQDLARNIKAQTPIMGYLFGLSLDVEAALSAETSNRETANN